MVGTSRQRLPVARRQETAANFCDRSRPTRWTMGIADLADQAIERFREGRDRLGLTDEQARQAAVDALRSDHRGDDEEDDLTALSREELLSLRDAIVQGRTSGPHPGDEVILALVDEVLRLRSQGSAKPTSDHDHLTSDEGSSPSAALRIFAFARALGLTVDYLSILLETADHLAECTTRRTYPTPVGCSCGFDAALACWNQVTGEAVGD